MRIGIVIISYYNLENTEGFKNFTNAIKIQRLDSTIITTHIGVSDENLSDIVSCIKQNNFDLVYIFPFVMSKGHIYEDMEKMINNYFYDIQNIIIIKPIIDKEHTEYFADALIKAFIPKKDEQILLLGHGSLKYGNNDYEILANSLKAKWEREDIYLAMLKSEPYLHEILPYLKENNKPILIIPLFLKVGHHFTSDIIDENNSVVQILLNEKLKVRIEKKCLLDYPIICSSLAKMITK